MDVNLNHKFVLSGEALEKLKGTSLNFQGPPNIVFFPSVGDHVTFTGLESFTFVITSRRFTFSAAAIEAEYVIDLVSHNPPSAALRVIK